MKAVAVALVTVGLGAVGANELLSADTNAAGSASAASASAKSGGAGGCWAPGKIQKDRYTLRGAQGSIRSFEINNVEGCVFRVKIEYTTVTGANKMLDYNAEFARGEAPTFKTYNSPP